MNRFLYRMMYLFSKPGWDSGVTPPEVVEAFEKGGIPPGAALDLGCGTGTNVIFMAQHGRKAIGLDFVSEAINSAQRKAKSAGVADQVDLRVADVTKLAELNLPQIAFALDMGCFHGLSAHGQRAYASALAGLMIPGGQFMLYTLDPHRDGPVSFGVTPEQVMETFGAGFDITRQERGSFWQRSSTWSWLARRARPA